MSIQSQFSDSFRALAQMRKELVAISDRFAHDEQFDLDDINLHLHAADEAIYEVVNALIFQAECTYEIADNIRADIVAAVHDPAEDA